MRSLKIYIEDEWRIIDKNMWWNYNLEQFNDIDVYIYSLDVEIIKICNIIIIIYLSLNIINHLWLINVKFVLSLNY